MSKQKVAFICPSKSWGGLEMNVLKLSLWLQKRGRDILLYCTPSTELYIQAKKNRIEVRDLESHSKMHDIMQAKTLANSLKNENIRLVLFHLNSNFPMMAVTKLLSRNSFKLLYMQHMHLGGNKTDFLHTLIYKKLDCWIAPLQMFAKRLTGITTITNDKIEVIPFGIELNRFLECAATKAEARQQLKLLVDKTLVGFVGRIDSRKGQHLLIEAAHSLQQQNVLIDVLLVGDCTKNEELSYKEKLKQLIKKYNLEERVHFRSHLDKVEVAFKALDIFCLTTDSETFGMVTVEAMASGLPVLGSNEGGTTEIIRHEKNGLLYKSGSSDEIALAVKRLLDDPQLSEKLAGQAKIDAQKNYAHTAQCDALEICFDKLI